MEKICVVIGRKIQDNLDRDLNLIPAFKRHNINTHFLMCYLPFKNHKT